MSKSKEMNKLLENVFGRTTAMENGVCPLCQKKITGFRDSLSEKEYTISGMCQECQDVTFNQDSGEQNE